MASRRGDFFMNVFLSGEPGSATDVRAAAERALLQFASILIDGGATEAELASRFAELDVVITPLRARRILAQLGHLGLAGIASVTSDASSARFVTTVLGRREIAAVAASAELDAQLADLEHLRNELISAVAHELRTPLTAIRTCVGLLQDEHVRPNEAETQQLLANIAASAERMQQFVADVLDIARFRAGSVRLQLRQFDAVALVHDVARLSEPLIATRRQRLHVDAPAPPIPVYADRRRVEQVLVNLLSNASKFSPDESEIVIDVQKHDSDVIWSVRDHGAGIPPEDQPHLFERFFVANPRGDSAGTGLGLPLSLAIAEAHQGSIEVETEVGRGSTFRLRIPASALASNEPA
jgi:signal transduction histidine kinase